MKIQKRGINKKRHTTHYLVGGKWRTKNETVSLAEQGRIEGVIVYQRGRSKYIQAHPDYEVRLSDLPSMMKM